jgi:hypothetical protein
MDLAASSAVNLPITSANLRLVVVRIGIRSSHCTYLVARVAPLVTFTTNLVGFMVPFNRGEKRSRCLDFGWANRIREPERIKELRKSKSLIFNARPLPNRCQSVTTNPQLPAWLRFCEDAPYYEVRA